MPPGYFRHQLLIFHSLNGLENPRTWWVYSTVIISKSNIVEAAPRRRRWKKRDSVLWSLLCSHISRPWLLFVVDCPRAFTIRPRCEFFCVRLHAYLLLSLSPHPAFFLYTKAHTSASCEHWRRLTTKAGRMMLQLAFIFKWSSLASKPNWRKWTSKYSRNRLRDFAHFVTVANIKRSSDFQLSWKLLVTKRQTRL